VPGTTGADSAATGACRGHLGRLPTRPGCHLLRAGDDQRSPSPGRLHYPLVAARGLELQLAHATLFSVPTTSRGLADGSWRDARPAHEGGVVPPTPSSMRARTNIPGSRMNFDGEHRAHRHRPVPCFTVMSVTATCRHGVLRSFFERSFTLA